MSSAARREVALRACVIAFAILAAFALGGRTVLEALGITIPAFRVAGGLLLFYVAFDMLFALRGERKREIASDAVTVDHIRNVAAFPLRDSADGWARRNRPPPCCLPIALAVT